MCPMIRYFLKQEFSLMNNYVLFKMFSTMIYPVAMKVSAHAQRLEKGVCFSY